MPEADLDALPRFRLLQNLKICSRCNHPTTLAEVCQLRVCPNAKCRIIHEDEVGQCPQCGAAMGRKPDVEMDVNTHLYGYRNQAGQATYAGGRGGIRPGGEPNYPDTKAVQDVARQLVLEGMEEK